MNTHPEIYFHVGLGKVASTYLQQRVFPKLKGLYYIPTGKYRHCKKIIPSLKGQRILISREFDRQFEKEVRWFTGTYPQARIIVLFRRHDDWIASQYRRHVKNGWYHGFTAFFDPEKDQGLWKHSDLLFYPKLEVIEACCENKPLVLFYDELLDDSGCFLKKIASYTNTALRVEKISTKRVHTSYGEKELKVLQAFCKKYVRKVPQGYQNRLKHWLRYRPYWALFHLILYAARLIPERFVPNKPLIHESVLSEIRSAYKNDWKKVQEYARRNNPEF